MLLWTSPLILGLLLITYLFFRISKAKNPFILGMLFAGAHFFFVVIIAALVYLSIKQQSPDSPMWGWFIPFMIDIPTSFLIYCLPQINKDYMWQTLYEPFLFFALLGSIQYFLIGTGLGCLYRRFKRLAA